MTTAAGKGDLGGLSMEGAVGSLVSGELKLRKARVIAFGCGVGLLAWLVMRSGPGRLAHDMLRIGWWMSVLLVISAVRNLLRTGALRLALGSPRDGKKQQFSFWSLYGIMMVTEAIKFAIFAGLVFGEAAKGWLLNRRVTGPRAASTVMIDVLLYYLTSVLFSLMSIVLFFGLYPSSGAIRHAGIAGAAVLVGIAVLGAIAFHRRWLSARRLITPLAELKLIRRRETLDRLDEIDERLFSFHREQPGAFRLLLVLDFGTHVMATMEVLVIMWVLGLGGGFVTAVVVEGMSKVVDAGGMVVPGDIGLYQGGMGLIFRALGYSMAIGVSIGIIRQIRSILWAGLGFLVLLLPWMAEERGTLSRHE